MSKSNIKFREYFTDSTVEQAENKINLWAHGCIHESPQAGALCAKSDSVVISAIIISAIQLICNIFEDLSIEYFSLNSVLSYLTSTLFQFYIHIPLL